MPTEAEWEYAARAGTSTAYWWGNDIGSNNANCDGCGSQWDNKQTAPTGSFTANAWGLRDTAGNVWEWTCTAWRSSYTGQEKQCATDASSYWVVRGGAWLSTPQFVRSADRNIWGLPGNRDNILGFRLARTDPWPFYTSLRVEKPEMVAFAEGGSFKMGGEAFNDEKPIHDVTLSPFEIGKYEVTVGEFKRFVEVQRSSYDSKFLI